MSRVRRRLPLADTGGTKTEIVTIVDVDIFDILGVDIVILGETLFYKAICWSQLMGPGHQASLFRLLGNAQTTIDNANVL